MKHITIAEVRDANRIVVRNDTNYDPKRSNNGGAYREEYVFDRWSDGGWRGSWYTSCELRADEPANEDSTVFTDEKVVDIVNRHIDYYDSDLLTWWVEE